MTSSDEIAFKEAWSAFLAMRISIRQPASERAIKGLKSKLKKLSKGDVSLATEIIKKATKEKWLSFYPL